jgi:tetratricopeptide (TPR) repeat protein
MKQLDQIKLSACTLAVLLALFANGPARAEATPAKKAPSAAAKPALPVVKLPAPAPEADEALYQILIAEIASQRGRADLGSRSMIDLATRTNDARVARRAAEIAFLARQTTEARDALVLWLSLEPESGVARQALSALLGVPGPIEKVAETCTQWLADPKVAPVLFMQLPALLSRYNDAARVATIVAQMADKHPMLSEAKFAVAMTAFNAGNSEAARRAIDDALKLKPAFGRAAIAKAQFMRDGKSATNVDDEAAAQFLDGFLKAHPDQTFVRVTYARLLASMKSFLSAREQFRMAAVAEPDNPELPFAMGLISQEMGDSASAATQLQRALDLKPRDRNPVLWNLGLVADARGDAVAAEKWYREIGEGDYFVSAQLKIAQQLQKREGMPRARTFLREAREAENDAPRVQSQLLAAEVQLLRDAKQFADAIVLLDEAVKLDPQSVELRYDRAMLLEKVDRYPEMEADLRVVIAIKPDHAHAYNALGYSFADRGVRLAEAYDLIKKATELAPDDAYILDSLGWVQFKMGRRDDALKTLRQAYQMRPDGEIAAHIGEVLWSMGKRDEARAEWDAALKKFPDHAAVKSTMERLAK